MKTEELTKLAILLSKADIPFEIYPFFVGDEATFQLATPSKKDCYIDAVSHQFSYGGADGLIEILGDEADGYIDVIGWLSAEEAFLHFEKVYRNHKE